MLKTDAYFIRSCSEKQRHKFTESQDKRATYKGNDFHQVDFAVMGEKSNCRKRIILRSVSLYNTGTDNVGSEHS